LSTSGGVFVTDCRAVAEAQVRAIEHQREMQIMQAEAQARERQSRQSGIITPSAMQVPGIGRVPTRGNGNPGRPQGEMIIQIPPDGRWRARRFDEWWKEVRANDVQTVDLRG